MAVYKYFVEGIYETDKGNGKDYTNFNFEIELSRFEGKEQGAGSHILRRFLPILIKRQKNKPLFSGIKHWVITDIQKISDEFPLEGKDIAEMNEYEIQELACMYDLFEIPLPSTVTISEMREKAQKAYLSKVLDVKMKTPSEQMESDFFVPQPDGTLKFDLKGRKLKVDVFCNTGKKEVKEKKTLDYYIEQARQKAMNIISKATGDMPEKTEDNFPSLDDLQPLN